MSFSKLCPNILALQIEQLYVNIMLIPSLTRDITMSTIEQRPKLKAVTLALLMTGMADECLSNEKHKY